MHLLSILIYTGFGFPYSIQCVPSRYVCVVCCAYRMIWILNYDKATCSIRFIAYYKIENTTRFDMNTQDRIRPQAQIISKASVAVAGLALALGAAFPAHGDVDCDAYRCEYQTNLCMEGYSNEAPSFLKFTLTRSGRVKKIYDQSSRDNCSSVGVICGDVMFRNVGVNAPYRIKQKWSKYNGEVICEGVN